MAFPPNVPLVTLTAGSAYTLETAEDLSLLVTINAVRPNGARFGGLVWAETGERFPAIGDVVTAPPGQPVQVDLPATNAEGWRTVEGAPIDVDGGSLHTHAYVISIEFRRNGARVASLARYGPVFLPEGDSPVDLDTLVVVPQESGVLITLPDLWTSLVEQALTAAEDSEQSASDAAQSASDAAQSASDAAQSASQADQRAGNAEQAASDASQSASDALDEAQAASQSASNAENIAQTAVETVEPFALAASQSADAASDSADDASGFADAASGSATAASGFADAASDSADAAAQSRDGVDDALEATETARDLAVGARTGAETARDEAVDAKDDAEGFASAASGSASAASGSASAAAGSATGAQTARTGAESARDDAFTYRNEAQAATFAGAALGTADLNDITTPGHYHQATSASATLARNYPADFGAWNVEVLATGASARIQRATRHWLSGWQQPFGFWERSYNGSTLGWQPWRFFPSQRVDNTAGRAIYTWDDTANREQLIRYDSGWRDISSLLSNGWTLGESGAFEMRRFNDRVDLRMRNLLVGATATFLAGLPDGFRVRGANSLIPIAYGTGEISVLRIRDFERDMRIDPIPPESIGDRYTSVWASWPTGDTTPTTLPGTPVGSIPYN